MQVLNLKIGDKTYTTARITAYLSRKAMEISRKAVELAGLGAKIQESAETDYVAVKELMDSMTALSDLKSWFICQVYGEKFSIDDLEKNLTDEEIEAEVDRITQAIYGIIPKNG